MQLFRTEIQRPNCTLRCYPELGERVPVMGASSEVLSYMRLADKPIEISLAGEKYRVCQLWVNGKQYSFPVTTGEGGFYPRDYDSDLYYTYADESRLTRAQLALARPSSEEDEWVNQRIGISPGCSPSGTTTANLQASQSGPPVLQQR